MTQKMHTAQELRKTGAAPPDPEAASAAAAHYIDLGWPVFPVAGKVPLPGSRGVKDATRDHALAASWWPPRTNLGVAIATGRPASTWVLDVDGLEGAASLQELERERGPLPATVEARTSRGRHIYFRLPADAPDVRNSAGVVAPGVDVRGSGGYVVAPPSPHPSGDRYRWAPGRDPDTLAIASAPAWLLELLNPPAAPPAPSRPVLVPVSAPAGAGERYVVAAIERECLDVAGAREGTRNATLNRAAFALARFVQDGRARRGPTIEALTIAAKAAGLSDIEARRTIRSAFGARAAA
jgi:hypothetical protein